MKNRYYILPIIISLLFTSSCHNSAKGESGESISDVSEILSQDESQNSESEVLSELESTDASNESVYSEPLEESEILSHEESSEVTSSEEVSEILSQDESQNSESEVLSELESTDASNESVYSEPLEESEILSHEESSEVTSSEEVSEIFSEDDSDVSNYEIILDSETELEISDDGTASFVIEQTNFLASNVSASLDDNCFLTLNHLGLLINETPFYPLDMIHITASGDLENLTICFGDYPMPFLNPVKMTGNSIDIDSQGSCYFAISYQGEEYVDIEYVLFSSKTSSEFQPIFELPTVEITTDVDGSNIHLPIDSLTNYTQSKVSVLDQNDEKHNIVEASAGVRLRGNSTSTAPKKPYRIKFDKKQSPFGLTKNKSFVLLAEYFDGSSMHNYMAQKMVSLFEDFNFPLNMKHVNLYLNGEYQGLYVFCEQPDEKEGRLDIVQDITLESDVTTLNFLLELDFRLSPELLTDPEEVEDVTYFKVTNNEKNYFYSIKYPEISDFPDYDSENSSSNMFSDFVAYLKMLIGNVWDAVESGNAKRILNYLDKETLFEYATIDMITGERDHQQSSFKFYRKDNSKIKMGPCWDYDTVAYGFYSIGKPYSDPFAEAYDCGEWFGNDWARTTVSTTLLYEFYPFIKQYCTENKEAILDILTREIANISFFLIKNSLIWQKRAISTPYQNIVYLYHFLETRLDYFINRTIPA